MCLLPLKQRKSAMINQQIVLFSIHVLILSVEAATKTILYGYEHF